MRPVVWYACIWLIGAYMGLFAHAQNFRIAMAAAAGLLVLLRLKGAFGNAQMAAALVIFIGSLSYNGWVERTNMTSLAAEDGDEVTVRGTILSAVRTDGDRVIFTLKGMPKRIGGEPATARPERFRVTIRLASEAEKEVAARWMRGMRATIDGTLQLPSDAGNFDAFDYRTYLHRQRIHWIVEGNGIQSVQVSAGSRYSPHSWLAFIDRLRGRLAEQLDRLFPDRYGGLMQSQLIGWKADLDPEQYDRFAHVGLAHVLAISGMHVGIFLGMLLLLYRLFGIARETGFVISMMLIPVYILLTGAAPPVVRAGLMAMIGLEAARRNRLRDGLAIICLCAWGMQAASPYLLSSISYQMSFLITLGLILFVRPVYDVLPALWPPLRSSIAVAVAAQFLSFPLVIYYFNHFSWLSFAANLLLLPLLSVVVIPLGMIAMLVSLIHVPSGQWLAVVPKTTLDVVFQAIEMMMRVDPFGTIWPTPPEWWVAAYYAMLAVMIRSYAQSRLRPARPLPARIMQLRRRNWTGITVSAGIVLSLLLMYAYEPNRWDRSAVVSFLDVGQGDAVLVRTPEKRHILIDSGGTLRFDKPGEAWKERTNPYEVGKDLLVPLLKKRGVHRIDYLILTHGDTDHIGGALAVIQEIPVKRIIFNGTLRRSHQLEQLFRLADQKKVPLYAADRGNRITIDCCSSVSFLHPDTEPGRVALDDAQNRNSIVMLLRLYDRHFLLTGDVDARGEEEILAALASTGTAGAMPRIDVMKAAHHGSKSSSSALWLNAWQPKQIVISAGARNPYGHPHPSVLERLHAVSEFVWRTDRHGEIRFVVKPHELKAIAKRGP